MAHMGWSDPKTAIRYVQKSKQSAHQMAMYLCNAQRSNLRAEDMFRIPKVMPPKAVAFLPDRVKIPVDVSGVSSFASSSGCASVKSAQSSLSSGVTDVIPSTSSFLPVNASGFLASSVSVSGTHILSCESNEGANLVAESNVVKTQAGSSSVAASEGLNPLPAVVVDNQSVERQVASCLTSLVGSLVNSGTINFNVSFVSK